MTWDDIVQLASDFPEVLVSTSYGTPALKVRGKLLTRLRPEDSSLVFMDVPNDEREVLIATDPSVFHTTPHYRDYPTVLAFLATLEPETARAFLERRWRNIAPKAAVATRQTHGGRPRTPAD